MNDRRKARINKFFSAANMTEDEYDKCMNEEKAMDDFNSILSSAVQDEEDAKVTIYASLLKSILTGKVQNDYKIHIMKAVKELSVSDIALIQKIYIASKHESSFKNRSSLNTVKQLVSVNNPLKSITIQKFERLGFLLRDANNILKHSDLLEQCGELIFPPEELLPEAIGEKVWLPITAFLVKEVLNDEIFRKFELFLSNNNLAPIMITFKALERPMFLNKPIFILLLEEKDSSINVKSIDAIKRANGVVIKILLDMGINGLPYDPLPAMNADFSFAFNKSATLSDPQFYELKKVLQDIAENLDVNKYHA